MTSPSAHIQIDSSVSKLRQGAPGQLVFFQRHGQASKNKVLRPERLALVDRLEKLLEQDPDFSNKKTAADANAVLESWREAANAPQWFDDSLNPAGVTEAATAGVEIGKFLADVGRTPDLLVTSPFRRAWQTQSIGYSSANLAGMPGCSSVDNGAPAWVANDDLSETPYCEGPCKRHPKSVLSRWQPCLNVDSISEECEVGSETNLDYMWKAMCDESKRRQEVARNQTKEEENAKEETHTEAKFELNEELLDNQAQVTNDLRCPTQRECTIVRSESARNSHLSSPMCRSIRLPSRGDRKASHNGYGRSRNALYGLLRTK